jgi:hypothetical protein
LLLLLLSWEEEQEDDEDEIMKFEHFSSYCKELTQMDAARFAIMACDVRVSELRRSEQPPFLSLTLPRNVVQ